MKAESSVENNLKEASRAESGSNKSYSSAGAKENRRRERNRVAVYHSRENW